MRLCLAIVLLLPITTTAQAPATSVSFVNERTLNAPIAEVWKTWSTADGYKRLGPALTDMDFRIGGLIRARYDANGTLGDALTIENEILAFEPPRMLAIRIHKIPENFPYREAWKHTWTVFTLTELPDGRTHVRAASLGFGNDPESIAMRRFFERGNEETLDTLSSHLNRVAK
jgi:uncharacterized protein YndB with AHSA1/START domain